MIALFVLLSCADPAAEAPTPPAPPACEPTYRIEPEGPAGPLTRFLLIRGVQDQECVDCRDGLTVPPSEEEVVLRAPGHARFAGTLDFLQAGPCEPRVARPLLLPLPEAIVTDDYRTGFEGEQAAAQYRALAHRGASRARGPSRTVKLWVDPATTPPTLYFVNTQRHELHYPFYRDILGGTLSAGAFASKTYHGAERLGFAAALVHYPELTVRSSHQERTLTGPTVLRFDRTDTLTPEQAAWVLRHVQDQLWFIAPDTLFYLPPSDEAAEAAIHSAAFAPHTPYLLPEELSASVDLEVMNPGVATGTLRIADPEAPVAGFRDDILVLERLPNTLAPVAGTITAEPQTPLAHVNVAARARGTPNLYLRDALKHPDIQAHLGSLVRLDVTEDGYRITPATTPAIRALPEPGTHPVPTPAGGPTDPIPLARLGHGDVARVGAKAANLAELRTVLPEHTPDGLAIPLSAYQAFMQHARVATPLCEAALEDCTEEGRDAAVCAPAHRICLASTGMPLQAYAERLLDEPSLAALPHLEAALNGLRFHIGHTPLPADLAQSIDRAVAEALPERRVRLRSSTNAEDLPGFSGAGLYRSVSAGPDKGAPSDRIRKVWASLWSWRATEERALDGIDHRHVAMGVLVHPAYPDEAVNAVLLANPTAIDVNAQAGEAAVTNPADGALPETGTLTERGYARSSASSLHPAPLLTPAELDALWHAVQPAVHHFDALYGQPQRYDLEVKWLGDDRRLLIKQIRPYSEARTTPPTPPEPSPP